VVHSIQSWRYGLYVQVWNIGPEIEDMDFGSRWSAAFRARRAKEEIENEEGGEKEKEDEEGKNYSFLGIFV
jgi:hypothetical protein